MTGVVIWRRVVGVAAIVAAACAVVLVTLVSEGEEPACWQAFDARRWSLPESQETNLGRGSPRLAMAEDLVRCGALDGMTKTRVRAVLGRPEYPDQYPDRLDEGGPCYDLGLQPELGGLDSRVLCLTYGRSGRVERASVFTS